MTRGLKMRAIHKFKPGSKVYAKVRGRWRRCVVESFQSGFHEWYRDEGQSWFGQKDRVTVRPLRGKKTYDLVADRRYVQTDRPVHQLVFELEAEVE
jgi:hypothetical protein